MPDSSSKSGSPRQPSSRPPFQEGLAGDPLFELECRIPARKADRGSAWKSGFQLEKRIPKTTFITAPFQGIDPLFNLPQDNLHHGPLFRRDWLGIRFSSWNAGFQLEKRIPKTTFITAPFSGGIGWGSAFRAGMPDSSSKSGSPRQPSSRPPFSGMPDSSSKSGSPRPPFRRDWPDPLFKLECRIPARKADPQDNLRPGIRQLEKRIPKTTFITAPFQEGLAGDPLFELECRIPARKADPQDNLHHGPLSGGVRFFRRHCALFFRTFGCFFPLCGVRTFSARSGKALCVCVCGCVCVCMRVCVCGGWVGGWVGSVEL